MKITLTLPSVAILLAAPTLAEPVTRTVTVDRLNYDATQTTVRDRDAGTLSRDTNVIRESDGATATRSFDRVRTGNSVTRSGSETGFNGKTRSFEYERTKTDNGSIATGSATGHDGETLNFNGSRERTNNGYISNQNVTNGQGRTLFNRDVVQTRADGQVSRSVDVSRAAGFRPRRFAHPRAAQGRRSR